MRPILNHIQLPGRVRLEFAVQGNRDGTPVIALHGVTDSWRSFEPVLPHLPPDLRVLALTQRGHGGSDKPAGGYRVVSHTTSRFTAAFMPGEATAESVRPVDQSGRIGCAEARERDGELPKLSVGFAVRD